ncbi:hypothetical protein TNCV_3141581 [Trichonephila clavipes]|nr:hypothetical protein TNCV_3141581 [Trichonephila clavipes]
MAAVDFLNQENPPTWAGVEPATLGTEDQRQTNYATQPAFCKRNMRHFTSTELADMYLIYGLSEGNARAAEKLYHEKYAQTDAPNHRMFTNLHHNLCVNMDYYEVIGIVKTENGFVAARIVCADADV